MAAAREEKMSRLNAWTSRDNHSMQQILRKCGFTLKDSMDDPTVAAYLSLEKDNNPAEEYKGKISNATLKVGDDAPQ